MAEDVLSEKERFAVIKRLSDKLDKAHGTTNSLVRLGSQNLTPIPSIPMGLPTLDYDALQFGGVPRGRIV